MTPLAAGQRWVPSKKGSRAKARLIRGIDPDSKWPIAWDNGADYGAMTEAEFRTWIARHDARLENDGAGDGG